jgi:glycerol-3-phosphate O-acyltransferase
MKGRGSVRNPKTVYPQVLPKLEDWPIYKLSEDRKKFVEEIDEHVLRRLTGQSAEEVEDLLTRAIYQERIRVKEEPWKVDPPNEKQFWRRIRRQLIRRSLDQPREEAIRSNAEILQKIVHRYSEEIVGTFRIKTFLFARRFLTFFFNRLLQAKQRGFFRARGARKRLYEKLIVRGEVEKLRSLFEKGTVVVVPTHFSNLDSILIGYALDAVVGLPSFSYGAGLNLYNTGYTAYFMNRLGAYRVDRRKKNAIYLETLKGMSTLSIKRGTNSLFFPGGTRSRSGQLETKLKMGLLGTVIEAQRALYQEGKDEKIFVVPLVLGYHFVLEAPFLIEQHLKRMGKERYIRAKDDFFSPTRVLRYAWKVLSEGNDITLSFGQPLDVMGNIVDEEGNSYDKYGNPIQVREYFESDGAVTENLQRENEYTRQLAGAIVQRYHEDNIVLSSHLVAFAAFNILKKDNAKLDLYGVMRLPTDEYIFPMETLHKTLKQLQQILLTMSDAGKIKLSDQIYGDTDDLIQHGIFRLGTFHLKKPLRFTKKGTVVSDSFHLLYYYHNRLENYGLDKKINWKEIPLDLSVKEQDTVAEK